VKKLSVLIPSRTQPRQATFLEHAVRSIRAQSAAPGLSIEILVGLDRSSAPPPIFSNDPALRFIESKGNSQAAALNACAGALDGDYVAFLEDDDQWHPERVAVTLAALDQGNFVSSTQLEVDPAGSVIRINDFPTPSGWFMPTATWERVGAFNEEYRLHLDNEWLGRLAESGTSRIHLVEATAPVRSEVMAQVRPWLASVLRLGGPHVRVLRHRFPVPLVTRLVHPGAGTFQIATKPEHARESEAEISRLVERFGRVPW
jgi:glycosyltransferase involved in cell wall biosynthesis